MTIPRLSILLCAAAIVTACSEKAQTSSEAPTKSDAPSWQGAENRYVTPGWIEGDHVSWEAQLRKRTQTQNEYVRISH